MAKLQNIKAVKQLLVGEHKTQTRKSFGFRSKKDVKKRQVGEVWEETLPDGSVVVWEQRNGYRRRYRKNMKQLLDLQLELQQYPKCYDDCKKKETKKYHKLDEKCRDDTGMCLDCYARFETQLRADGKWQDYVKEKQKQNTIQFLKDAEKEKEMIKQAMQSVEYINEDGTVEQWSNEGKEKMINKIDKDFEKLKKELLSEFND